MVYYLLIQRKQFGLEGNRHRAEIIVYYREWVDSIFSKYWKWKQGTNNYKISENKKRNVHEEGLLS